MTSSSLGAESRPANFAVYLDEAGDDPHQAAATLLEHRITDVCLRRAWGHAISDLQDEPLAIIREILLKNKLKVVCLCGTSGDTLNEKKLKREVVLAQFFGSQRLRVHWQTSTQVALNRWLELISELTLSANIQPLIEPTRQWQSDAAALSTLLARYKRVGLIYDAAGLLARGKMHPLAYIWTLLKNRVQLFDIRDFIQGMGPRPAGSGECKLDLTISDSLGWEYRGWYCLEPGLGTRYSGFQTRADTFGCALEAFESIWVALRNAYGTRSESGDTKDQKGRGHTRPRGANAGPQRHRWVAENRDT